MEWFYYFAIIFTGFTACAEFGSFLFVHPVIRRLPPKYHIIVEKGLVKTFGRVMPLLMTGSMAITITIAISLSHADSLARIVAFMAAGVATLSVISTIAFNVPRNFSVSHWSEDSLPDDWKKQRNIWELFQGVRATLLLISFLLLTAGIIATAKFD